MGEKVLIGTAVGDPDGEQLGHCDVGIMLGALVGRLAVIGLELGDVVGPEVDRSPLGSMQRLFTSVIVGCLHKVEVEL